MTITHLIFDWGDTLMRDFPEKPEPMAHWDVIVLFEGVEKTLQELTGKYILAVATNAGVSDTKLMREALNRGNIEQYFSWFFSSKDLGFSKPDIRFFTEICNQMNVNPSQCLFIGNDYKKDIEGAADAGMKTILFNHQHQTGALEKAHCIIENFCEIAKVVGGFED
jgi:putative hydrolase of the HAD superfamily